MCSESNGGEGDHGDAINEPLSNDSALVAHGVSAQQRAPVMANMTPSDASYFTVPHGVDTGATYMTVPQGSSHGDGGEPGAYMDVANRTSAAGAYMCVAGSKVSDTSYFTVANRANSGATYMAVSPPSAAAAAQEAQGPGVEDDHYAEPE